jgi:restriction system protein
VIFALKNVGSFAGQNATSYYTRAALDYVITIQHKDVLIDGDTLIQLMIENDVGASLLTSYDIKKIDYFMKIYKCICHPRIT